MNYDNTIKLLKIISYYNEILNHDNIISQIRKSEILMKLLMCDINYICSLDIFFFNLIN